MSSSDSSGAGSGEDISLRVYHRDGSTLTLLVDPAFVEAHQEEIGENPHTWTAHPEIVRVAVPEQSPTVRLFFSTVLGQLVAAQFRLNDYDAVSATRLLHARVGDWTNMFGGERRVPATASDLRRQQRLTARQHAHNQQDPLLNAPYVAATALDPYGSSSNPSNHKGLKRPTLFALLTRIAEANVATAEQRAAIRAVITDYLSNELSHNRVFLYLGQVLGFRLLDELIQSLTEELNSSPEGANSPEKPSAKDVVQTQDENCVMKTSEADSGAPRKRRDVSSNENQKNVTMRHAQSEEEERKLRALLFRSLIRPFRLIPLTVSPSHVCGRGIRVSHRFIDIVGGWPDPPSIAGAADRKRLHAGNDGNAAGPKQPSLECIKRFEIRSFASKTLRSSGDFIPPSLIGHSANAGVFATGPVSLLYGGVTSGRKSRESAGLENAADPQETEVEFNASLWSMDAASRLWVVLDGSSPKKPSARHSHAAATYPEHPSDTFKVTVDFLVIFGGVGPEIDSEAPRIGDDPEEQLSVDTAAPRYVKCKVRNLKLLNDLWLFDFAQGTWCEISISNNPKPSPRFGMQFVSCTQTTLLLYGGEGSSVAEVKLARSDKKASKMALMEDNRGDRYTIISGLPPGPAEPTDLLADTWLLRFDFSDDRRSRGKSTKEDPTKDLDMSKLSTLPVKCVFKKLSTIGIPRAHYGAVALSACLPSLKSVIEEKKCASRKIRWTVSSHVNDYKQSDSTTSSWIVQRIILLFGGAALTADGFVTDTASILLGLFDEEKENSESPVVVWRSLDNLRPLSSYVGPGFTARRNVTVVAFDTPAELPIDQVRRDALEKHALCTSSLEAASQENELELRDGKNDRSNHISEDTSCINQHEEDHTEGSIVTLVKSATAHYPVLSSCIFIYGGVTVRDGKATPAAGQAWILRLTPTNPAFLHCAMPEHEDSYSNGMLRSREQTVAAWSDPLRGFQPLLAQVPAAVCSGMLWSLATLTRSPLTALGHLVNNALAPAVAARHVRISFQVWRGHDCIVITDDGNGISHEGLLAMLRRFGNPTRDLFRRNPHEFGLGFKLGLATLAHNALVLTRTNWTFSAGLLSAPWNAMAAADSLAAPVVSWSSSEGFPLCFPVEEADFGQSVACILKQSPLATMGALESEFLAFGEETGTRIILFGLRKDIPHLVMTPEGAGRWVSYQEQSSFAIPTQESSGVNLPKLKLRARPLFESEESSSVQMKIGNKSDRSKRFKASSHGLDESDLSDSYSTTSDDKGNGGFSSDEPALTAYQLPPMFPLWNKAEDAIDYNIGTYLFWQHLHTGAQIRLNGVELTPPPALRDTMKDETADSGPPKASDPLILNAPLQKSLEIGEDLYQNSLYRYLQNRLYYKLEMPYLFSPKFGEEHFYGIVGFLNPHLETGSIQLNQPVCETGILLYHGGRLISRPLLRMPLLRQCFKVDSQKEGRVPPDASLFTAFTLTAVINVPSFLTPRATREEFMFEGDPVFDDFLDRLEKELRTYLQIYHDAEQLAALQKRYVTEFDAWRSSVWEQRSSVDHRSWKTNTIAHDQQQ